MEFSSTRGLSDSVGFTQAVAEGLAPDGGLYLPQTFPDLSPYLCKWENLSYEDLCFEFFKLFATDMDSNILEIALGKHIQLLLIPKLLQSSPCLINGKC